MPSRCSRLPMLSATRPVLEQLEGRRLLAVSSAVWDVTAASYLGGTANDDAVRGAVIQPDGTIVLAANISTATPGGLTPTLLNGATTASSGSLIRLSPDGRTVLSVTRLADRVLDLSADSTGNLFVALWTQGFAKVDPTATSLIYAKTVGDLGFANVQRIDAGTTGYVAVLGGGSLDSGTSLGENVQLYTPAGSLVFTSNDGKWKNDITVDETSQTVIYTGYRNAVDAASNLPVQISYYRGRAFDGSIKYTGYDWSTDPSSPNYINRPTNNMADTRGYRCDIGDDGLLYVGFESAGGNFIFRYDPFNIMQSATLAGGDAFQSAYNITSQHITFVGRYNPASGAFLNGQELVGRLNDGSANTIRLDGGNLTADANGRVYVVGQSAWSLPLPTHALYTHNALRPGFNPGVNNNYLGGSHLWVLEPDMTNRSYVTRLTGGNSRAVASRIVGSSQQVVFGGSTSNELYQLAPVQAAPGGGQDGYVGVIANAAATPGNVAPLAKFSYDTIEVGEFAYTIRFDASTSSDANGDPLTYRWVFGDGITSDQPVVEKTFTNGVTYNVTLTVRDGQGGWSQESLTLAPPTPDLKFNIGAGEAFSPVQFDASATTSLLSTPSELTYTWDFGDGTSGSGIMPTHSYTRGGVFDVKLTVSDPLGSSATITRPIAIATRGGFARRIDMNTSTSATAPGYTDFQLAAYSSSVGYGWREVTGDYNASSSSSTDPLFRDYHDYSKYPVDGHKDGEFLIDVPNGEYAVLIRLGHKTGHSYPAVLAEGVREAINLSVNNDGLATKAFQVVVADGQLNLTFIRENWFVAGIEVVNIGGTQPEWAAGAFRVNGDNAPAPARVGFDARGGQSGLNYAWDFGNGQTASGDRAWADYALPGTYPVTLTVSGGSSNRIIDFGGDMISSTVNGLGVTAIQGVDLDNDGNADDSTAFIPLGVERDAPFINGPNPRTRFHGGIANQQMDLPAGRTWFDDLSVTNSGAADYLHVRDQATNSIHRGLILASKADFLNGGHAQRVSFSATDSLSIRWTRWDAADGAVGRWVVRNGDTYYVSQATFTGTGTRTVNPATINWAVYTPTGPTGLNFDQATASFAPVVFDDVRAVGFLYERETVSSSRVWYGFDQFIVTAQLAPATYNLVVAQPVTRVSISTVAGIASETGPTPAQLVFARTGDTTDPLTVNYTLAGTASTADYASDVPLTGSLTIPAGVASVEVTVTPIDDALAEGSETLTLSLSSSLAYLPASPPAATVTILDNDVSIPAPATSSATAFSPRRIDIAWSDPSSSESGFRIERSTDGGSSWALAGSTGANTTSFVDRGLAPGSSYVYRVLTIQSSSLLSAPSPASVATTPPAILDDRFTTNTTGIWNFESYGPLGSPTEEYVNPGTNTNGLNNHDGALRARGYHTGTSSTESALHWLGLGPMRDLTGGSFSTTAIHAPVSSSNAWLAIRYGTPTGPKWAVSSQSVRTSATTSNPVPGDWKLNSFTWRELNLDDLNTPGAAVPAASVLTHALAAGVYSQATGAWLANVMPIIDSFTLEAGQLVPPLTAAFDAISPNPRVTPLSSATLRFLRPVTGLTAANLSLTLNGVPVSIDGVSLSTTDNQSWTVNGLASYTAPRGNYVLAVSGAGVMDDGGLLLNNSPELSWGKYVLGDINDDGQVNNQDIGPFVLALTDPQAFAQQYPQVPMPLVGDVNNDGVFNNQDIAPFVALLTGGRPATSSIVDARTPRTLANTPTRIAVSLFGDAPVKADRGLIN